MKSHQMEPSLIGQEKSKIKKDRNLFIKKDLLNLIFMLMPMHNYLFHLKFRSINSGASMKFRTRLPMRAIVAPSMTR